MFTFSSNRLTGHFHRQDTYIRVIGTIKSFANKRHLAITGFRPITDSNEIFYHLMEAQLVSLTMKRGKPEVRFETLSLSLAGGNSPFRNRDGVDRLGFDSTRSEHEGRMAPGHALFGFPSLRPLFFSFLFSSFLYCYYHRTKSRASRAEVLPLVVPEAETSTITKWAELVLETLRSTSTKIFLSAYKLTRTEFPFFFNGKTILLFATSSFAAVQTCAKSLSPCFPLFLASLFFFLHIWVSSGSNNASWPSASRIHPPKATISKSSARNLRSNSMATPSCSSLPLPVSLSVSRVRWIAHAFSFFFSFFSF